jgi:hypothetical protein
MSDALTISDVLARDVGVEWHEAVAVVRGVTEALGESPGNAPAVPDLHDIRISPAGRVEVSGGAVVQEPVRRLGQLLQATLGNSEPPVQLRLLISQATAPVPVYPTIQEFDAALGYFERPGRTTLIQGLHARASQVSVVAKMESAVTLDAIAPLPTPEPAAHVRTKSAAKARRRPAALVTAAAVILLVGCAAAVYLRSSTALRGIRVDGSTIAGRMLDRIGDAFVNGVSFVTEHVGLGRLVSAEAEAPAIPAPAEAGSKKNPSGVASARSHSAPDREATDGRAAGVPRTESKTSAVTRREPAAFSFLPSATVPFAAFDLEPARLPTPLSIVLTQASPAADLPHDHETSSEPVIHSQDSVDVSPPVAVRPQLPRELPPTLSRSELRRIELVISAEGKVNEVRLVGRPRNVHDSMLLSAAKAWEFRPAVKNGVPVMYRKTIWIAPQE